MKNKEHKKGEIWEEVRCTWKRRWEDDMILLREIKEGWSRNTKCEEEKIVHNHKCKTW